MASTISTHQRMALVVQVYLIWSAVCVVVFLGIECKAGKNVPTALQEKEMQDIRNAGGTTIVINEENLTMLGDLLKELTNDSTHEQGCTNPA